MITIKQARIACGMTQTQLAQASSVNIRLIQKLEGGEYKVCNITAKNFLAITRALMVDPYELDLGEEQPK